MYHPFQSFLGVIILVSVGWCHIWVFVEEIHSATGEAYIYLIVTETLLKTNNG